MLLTTVFDASVLYRNRDVPVPFSVLGLWELHGSSFCTSERISTVVGILLVVGICLCAVGCTAGVFTTLANCRNLNLKHLYC